MATCFSRYYQIGTVIQHAAMVTDEQTTFAYSLVSNGSQLEQTAYPGQVRLASNPGY
jgi:hypothetical protein